MNVARCRIAYAKSQSLVLDEVDRIAQIAYQAASKGYNLIEEHIDYGLHPMVTLALQGEAFGFTVIDLGMDTDKDGKTLGTRGLKLTGWAHTA